MRFEFENTRPMMSNEEILADLQRVASQLGVPTLPIRQYQVNGKFSHATVKKRFRSWNTALAAAGLAVVFVHELPDEELFDNLRQVWITLGRQPRKRELRPPLSRFTFSPYARRFGSWLEAMRAFALASEELELEAAQVSANSARPKHTPREPSLRLRFLVMRRDRFKCVLCGRSPASDPTIVLHIDHFVAWANGGMTEASNLRTLCSICNLGKSTLAAESGFGT
jgi:hypothetical protein